MEIWPLYREMARGKSLTRVLMNRACRRVALAGSGLDLGAGTGAASYHRYFQKAPDTRIEALDLFPRPGEVEAVNLEGRLPLDDASQDFLLLMNVLEHLYNYRQCLSECLRILRPGGRLIGAVPFLHRVHPDPDDFFRYTHSALQRSLSDTGFTRVEVEPLGVGPMTASVEQFSHLVRPRALAVGASVVAMVMDRALNRVFRARPGVRPDHYPLAYLFVAVK